MCDLKAKLFGHDYKYCITDRYEFGDELNSGADHPDDQPWCYATHEDVKKNGNVMNYCQGSFASVFIEYLYLINV